MTSIANEIISTLDIFSAGPCDARYTKTGVICVQCEEGTAKSEPGDQACTPCPSGTFSNAIDLTQCRGCPIDTVVNEAGKTSCEPCQAGLTSNAERTECSSCIFISVVFSFDFHQLITTPLMYIIDSSDLLPKCTENVLQHQILGT